MSNVEWVLPSVVTCILYHGASNSGWNVRSSKATPCSLKLNTNQISFVFIMWMVIKSVGGIRGPIVIRVWVVGSALAYVFVVFNDLHDISTSANIVFSDL